MLPISNVQGALVVRQLGWVDLDLGSFPGLLISLAHLKLGRLGLAAVLEHLSAPEGALCQEDDVLVPLQVEGLPELGHLDDGRTPEGAAQEAVLVPAAVKVLDAQLRRRQHHVAETKDEMCSHDK